MKILKSNNVYLCELGELEWYGASDGGKQSTIDTCLKAAREADCLYAAIVVQPDPVMSISPNPRRHQVWRHTFPTTAEHRFSMAISKACHEASDLPQARIKDILKTYLESYQ